MQAGFEMLFIAPPCNGVYGKLQFDIPRWGML